MGGREAFILASTRLSPTGEAGLRVRSPPNQSRDPEMPPVSQTSLLRGSSHQVLALAGPSIFLSHYPAIAWVYHMEVDLHI